MNRIKNAIIERLGALAVREDGQSMAEYGLILALISVVCIAAVSAIGSGVAAQFSAIAAQL